MASFLVTWEIDIETDTPRNAALEALHIQRRPGSTATVFRVIDEQGETHQIDLDADGENS